MVNLIVGKLYEVRPKKFPDNIAVIKVIDEHEYNYDTILLAYYDQPVVPDGHTVLPKSMPYNVKEIQHSDLVLYISMPYVSHKVRKLFKGAL
jgi:hypothetical protein